MNEKVQNPLNKVHFWRAGQDHRVDNDSVIPRRPRGQSFSVESKLRHLDLELQAPMYSLKAVFSGTEVYNFQERRVALHAGEFLLMASETNYRVQVQSRWDTLGRCYYFTEQEASPIIAFLDRFPGHEAPTVFDFDSLGISGSAAIKDAGAVAEMLRRWSHRWLEHEALVDRVDPLTRTRVLRGLERAKRAMDQEFSEAWSVETLAQLAQQSSAAFARDFSRVYQITPARYLQAQRLNYAVALLESSDLSVTQIAFDCGYPDLPTFSKAFRRSFGTSPSDWRSVSLS
ncbi:MAG: AraC family transcriptional regulator [Wenzhouxiangella sp.]|nr:AraC family transcriptional regulator [Wenzhouxiangella sp.]